MSLNALEAARDDFSIALIHSPELFDAAAERAFARYLSEEIVSLSARAATAPCPPGQRRFVASRSGSSGVAPM